MPNVTDSTFASSFYAKNPQRHCQDLTQPGPRNEAAWDALINRLDKFFTQHAHNWGLSDEEIQDITQDTLMQFMVDIDSGKFQCIGYSPITYVGTICRNVHRTHHRRMKKERPLLTDISQYVGDHDERQANVLTDPDTSLEEYCERLAIQQALAEQSSEHQKLLRGFYFDGQQLKDMADQKGYSKGYMRLKKNRIMKPFREACLRYFNTCLSNG